jgi:hypothetical protein
MKNLFYSFVLCISAISASAEGDSLEDQIKAHCSALGRIAFLTVEKYKTGRDIKEVKKELAAVVEHAAVVTNNGVFSDQFLADYNNILTDVYSTKQRKATDYAISYTKACKKQ